MERLKAALDKARGERATKVASTRSRHRSDAGASRERALVEEAWSSLEPLQLDKKRLLKRRIVTQQGGADATPYDLLRTKILHLAKANGWSRIAVTSPLPGSGKTTTTLNLAFSIARLIDKRAIVVDLDMRRPAISKALGVKTGRSTRAVLEGSETFAHQARRAGNNLAISMNFTGARDPSDLFLRKSTDDTIDRIEAEYRPDFMLFDMPPMLLNDDASAFLHNVDACLIIVEAGSTTLTQVDTCEKEVSERTNVLGVVLNKCKFDSETYTSYQYKY